MDWFLYDRNLCHEREELRGHRGRRYIDPTEPLILKTLTLHYKQVWMWQSIIHIVNLSLVMSYIHVKL